jgi:hypothetical protein
MVQNLHHLFGYKRDTPGKYVHEVRQNIRMLSKVVLLNVQGIVFKFDNGTPVVVDVAVVRSGENCYYYWEVIGPVPLVKLVPVDLCLVGADDRQEAVTAEKLFGGVCVEEKRSATGGVCLKSFRRSPILLINRIRPQYISVKSRPWRLLKSVHRIYVIQSLQFGRNSAMHR